jgi:hypothetical protein
LIPFSLMIYFILVVKTYLHSLFFFIILYIKWIRSIPFTVYGRQENQTIWK